MGGGRGGGGEGGGGGHHMYICTCRHRFGLSHKLLCSVWFRDPKP